MNQIELASQKVLVHHIKTFKQNQIEFELSAILQSNGKFIVELQANPKHDGGRWQLITKRGKVREFPRLNGIQKCMEQLDVEKFVVKLSNEGLFQFF